MRKIYVNTQAPVDQLMAVHGIPKTTAWRAKRRGYFCPGYHEPPKEQWGWPKIVNTWAKVYLVSWPFMTDTAMDEWIEACYVRAGRISTMEKPEAYMQQLAKRIQKKYAKAI